MIFNNYQLRVPPEFRDHTPTADPARPSHEPAVDEHVQARACSPSTDPCAEVPVQTPVSTPATCDGGHATAKLLSGTLNRAFNDLVLKLFVELIPLPQSGAFLNTAQALRIVCAGQNSARSKLRDVADILGNLNRSLDTDAARTSPSLQTLSSYLDAALPWIAEVAGQWHEYKLALADLSTPTDWISKTISILQKLEDLLQRPAFRDIAKQPSIQTCVRQFDMAKHMLAKLHLFNALPGDATLEDYLHIFADSPEFSRGLGQPLHLLVDALSAVCRNGPRPSSASLSDQIRWLTTSLTIPGVASTLHPHLEMILGGSSQAQQLIAISNFSNALASLPADASHTEQMRGLTTALASGDYRQIMEGTGLAWLSSIGQEGGGIVGGKRLAANRRVAFGLATAYGGTVPRST